MKLFLLHSLCCICLDSALQAIIKKIEAENSDFQYHENQLARLDNEIPSLLNNLKELVREDDFWAVINNDQDFSWSILFPAIGE